MTAEKWLRVPDIDPVAVDLACRGDRTVRLNADELARAVALCGQWGLSDHQTGLRLGLAAGTIAHIRAGGVTSRQGRPVKKASPPGPPPGAVFLTVAEVAREARVSKMTIYRLIHAGELDAVQVGRSFRVPVRAVREYLGKPAGAA